MTAKLSIEIHKLDERASLPLRSTAESAGYDIHAFLLTETGRASKRLIPPRNVVSIPTGIALRPPHGCAALVCSRSGLALKGVFVANAPGVIDPDYTGEIRILLFNGGFESYYVEHEQRIAQILVLPLRLFPLLEVASLPDTPRGDRGFGSTGE